GRVARAPPPGPRGHGRRGGDDAPQRDRDPGPLGPAAQPGQPDDGAQHRDADQEDGHQPDPQADAEHHDRERDEPDHQPRQQVDDGEPGPRGHQRAKDREQAARGAPAGGQGLHPGRGGNSGPRGSSSSRPGTGTGPGCRHPRASSPLWWSLPLTLRTRCRPAHPAGLRVRPEVIPTPDSAASGMPLNGPRDKAFSAVSCSLPTMETGMNDPSALMQTSATGPPPRTGVRPPVVERIAGWSARHRAIALIGWLLLVVGAVVIGNTIGTKNLNSYDPGEAGPAERGARHPGRGPPAPR